MKTNKFRKCGDQSTTNIKSYAAGSFNFATLMHILPRIALFYCLNMLSSLTKNLNCWPFCFLQYPSQLGSGFRFQ